MLDNGDVVKKLAKLESGQEEIMRRLDQMAESRLRDKEDDKELENTVHRMDLEVARLSERNGFLMKLAFGSAGGSGLAIAGHALRFLNVGG